MDTSTELDIGFDRLLAFLHQEMRMTEVYQPLVIRTLIHNGGEASFIELANAIAEHHGKSVAELSIGKNCPNAMITRIIRSDFVDFTYTSSAIALLESVTEERARMLTNTGKSA